MQGWLLRHLNAALLTKNAHKSTLYGTTLAGSTSRSLNGLVYRTTLSVTVFVAKLRLKNRVAVRLS
jgi:hypothetical protein